jgi:hypothetical protein
MSPLITAVQGSSDARHIATRYGLSLAAWVLENKSRRVETMTALEKMELALARIDAMPGVLKRNAEKAADSLAAEDMARYQQWHDDLDAQIRVERIK